MIMAHPDGGYGQVEITNFLKRHNKSPLLDSRSLGKPGVLCVIS